MTDLTPLTDVVREIAGDRAALDGLLDQRDDLIRSHLAAGVPYKVLGEATGLSRPMLDLIRRGERSRTD